MSSLHHARYLRFRPFPSDSPEGRAAERLRRAAWTMVAHIVSSATNVLVMVLSVSWTLPYLGVERFGAWMTITSLVTALSFLDLGVGNGLTNRVAQAASENSSNTLRLAISGGLGLLAALSLALLLLLATVAWLLPWEALIKSGSVELVDEVRRATLVFAVLFAVSTFTDGVSRVYHGLQRGYVVFATNTVFTLSGILMLYLASQRQASIPVLVLCVMGTSMFPGLFLWIRLWRKGLFRFTTLSQDVNIEKPKLIRVGVLFFVLQVGTSLGMGIDSLIVSSNLGASAVATYAIVQRIYLIVTQPMLILNGPLWPAYADADARNDRMFIRKTLATAGLITLLYSTSSVFALAWFSEPLIKFWTASVLSSSSDLVYALGAWTVVAAIANCFAMFMNGVGALKPQVIAVTVIVVVGVPLKILVVQSLGISAMVAAFASLFVITLGVLYGFSFRSHITRALGLTREEGRRK